MCIRDSEERALLEAQLRRALPEEQLVLFYQAQLDAGMRIVGAEVLLRWRHPQRGLVGPMQFIPLAEESGLIVPIGYWAVSYTHLDVYKRQGKRCRLWSGRGSAGIHHGCFWRQLSALFNERGGRPGRRGLQGLLGAVVVANRYQG